MHNDTSRLLRRGLFIVTFNALEDFLKSRMSELLAHASTTSLRFDELPSGLRKAAVETASRSGATQARFDRDNSEQIFQDVAAAIASTAGGSTLQLHPYSFLHGSSNVGAQDVADVLTALHVKDPWGQIDTTAAMAGTSTLPLRGVYESLHGKRNSAAHTGTSSIEVPDLGELVNAARVLAMCFDMLVSARVMSIRNNVAWVEGSAKVDLASTLTFDFVAEHPRGWAELRRDGRPLKVHSDVTAATSSRLTRTGRTSSLVVRLADGRPHDWYPNGY